MPPLVDCTDAMHSLGDINKKLKAMVEAAKRGGRPVPKYMQALYDNPMYGFGSNMSPEVFKTSSKRPILMLMRRCLGARRTMRRLGTSLFEGQGQKTQGVEETHKHKQGVIA